MVFHKDVTVNELAEHIYTNISYTRKIFWSFLSSDSCNHYVCFFPPLSGWNIIYKDLATLLPQCTCIAFDYLEDDDKIDQYVEIISQLCKNKIISIVGYSAGGNLAFEVLKALENNGITVKTLVLIETDRKNRNYNQSSNMIDNTEVETNEFYEFLLKIGFTDDVMISRNVNNKDISILMKNKISSYLSYIRSINNNGKVNANIKLLCCDENITNYINQWKNSTNLAITAFKCIGSHLTVLDTNNLIHNATLIRQCLT